MNNRSIRHHITKMGIACGILAASVSFGASAFAFSDLKGDPAEAKINALYEAGVINGVNSQQFAPKSKVTYGQAIQFLVNSLGLEKNTEPGGPAKASDYFAKIDDKSWYSNAFLIAVQNGLPLEKNADPSATVTRAEFVQLLNEAVQAKGDFAATEMYAIVTDGDIMSNEEMNGLQTLINMRIVALEDGGKFRPNDSLTRSEAAAWAYNARVFVQNTATVGTDEPENPDTPVSNEAAAVTVEKAADGVSKVSVTVDNLPHPGYGLSIAKIEFGKDKQAVIYYEITQPGPGMYPQVISSATAVTYLPEGYTVSAQPLPGSYTPPAADSAQY